MINAHIIVTALMGQVLGIWPMWGGEPTHRSVQLMRGAITTPVIKWGFGASSYVERQFAAVADADGDGHADVVFGSRDGKVYCLRGTNGTKIWDFQTGNQIVGVVASPTVADVDGDGAKEVVVGSADSYFYCIRGSDGVTKWMFQVTPNNYVLSSAAVVDLDSDGHMEVIFGSNDTRVYCLNGTDGTIKWTFTTGNWVQSCPAVADCDGDGSLEVVIGSYDHKVYCLAGSDGTQKWAFTTGGTVFSSPAIADVDGDGALEVVIGSWDQKIYCLRGSDGTQKWAYTTLASVSASPSLGDVDADGKLEVLIGSEDLRVYCLRGSDGSAKWIRTMPGRVLHPGALVDLDGDNKLEYLVSQRYQHPDTLFCLNAEDGSMVWKIALAYWINGPFAADVDDDSCIELVVGTYYSTNLPSELTVIDDPYDSTNCGQVTGLDESGFDKGFEFRPIGKSLYLFNSSPIQVQLEIYDPSGRLVQGLYNGLLLPGAHTFSPILRTGGIYLAVLRHTGGTKTIKVVR
ncbi:MAG: FG-GAP-like repeat-containing protein [candidate division WOR-3 bacterium]